jgi:hypothetical protein
VDKLEHRSTEYVKEALEMGAKQFPLDRLKKFPELKFKYVEEEQPEDFFVPYVWTLGTLKFFIITPFHYKHIFSLQVMQSLLVIGINSYLQTTTTIINFTVTLRYIFLTRLMSSYYSCICTFALLFFAFLGSRMIFFLVCF